MPPEGKPQPTKEEIALLQWWIDLGAPGDKKVAELKPNASIKRILGTRFGASPPAPKALAARPLKDVLPVANQLSEQLHVALSPISPKEPWLQCDAGIGGADFGDSQLAQLAPVAANLRWLDLGGTGVSDAGLSQVASMQNLVRLHLERTSITDAGLASLGELPNLEYLNLYGTAITSAGLEHLQGLPKLKQVYLWQTKVTPDAAKEFTAARTDSDQLQRWREEIEALQAKMRDARITVDLGTEVAAAPATNAAPVNAKCPVSGKPIDPTKTLVRDGAVVAFCCDDCKSKFQEDPKPFLAKLELTMPKNPTPKADK
jgi:YHS domain-containing protein